jgi:hypothetical protein
MLGLLSYSWGHPIEWPILNFLLTCVFANVPALQVLGFVPSVCIHRSPVMSDVKDD